jgi:hypothetical protein
MAHRGEHLVVALGEQFHCTPPHTLHPEPRIIIVSPIGVSTTVAHETALRWQRRSRTAGTGDG